MKHYIRVTSGPYSGAVYEFAAKKDALALARALEKVRPRSMDYGNDRDGFPEVHLKNRRAVNVSRRQHSTKTASASSGRWMHKDIARSHSVPEDVVRRIYASVQTAKKQGLYGGHAADLVERDVGRKLVGGEYDVYAKAKEHLSYDPPGGYSGPRPTGPAKEPPRAKYDDPKIERASRAVSQAERVIKYLLAKRKHRAFGWDWDKQAGDRTLLKNVADELDVAADLYEEAGAGVRAGTLRERARYARAADYARLESYGA